MSRGFVGHNQVSTGFPRVSGDEPLSKQFSVYRYGFSPRERG